MKKIALKDILERIAADNKLEIVDEDVLQEVFIEALASVVAARMYLENLKARGVVRDVEP